MRRPRTPRPFRAPSGPAQRVQQAQGDLGFMQANPGAFSQNQLFDAQVRARQAQLSFERAQKLAAGPPDFFNRAQAAMMSSRFSAGGGSGGGLNLMPLVGRTLAVFGKLNPAVSVATAGFSLLAASAQTFQRTLDSAAKSANAFGNAQMESGGTGQNIAGLTGMGIPAGDIPGAAAALHQRRASDPFAMLAGGMVMPRPFGNVNEAGELEEKLRELRAMGEGEEQLTQARMLGLEWSLRYINVSRRVQDAQQQAAALTGDIFDQKFTHDARDYAAAQNNVDAAWKRLEAAMTKPFIENATTALLNFAGAMDQVSKAANQHPGAVRGGASTAAGVAIGLPFGPLGVLAATFGAAKFQEWLSKMGQPGVSAGVDPAIDAQNANTKQLEQMNAYLATIVLGGGPRSRGAIPPGLLGGDPRRPWDESRNNRAAMMNAKLDLRGFRL